MIIYYNIFFHLQYLSLSANIVKKGSYEAASSYKRTTKDLKLVLQFLCCLKIDHEHCNLFLFNISFC